MENFAKSELTKMGFNQRIHRLPINNNPEGDPNIDYYPFFGSDSENNLTIFFPNIHGYLRTVKDGREIRPRYCKKTVAIDENEFKYDPLIDGINLFVHPLIAQKYKDKEIIKNLIICDDPVDSFILVKNDVDAIAIPGIQYLKEQSQITNSIWSEILDLCEICQVKSITYLLPSDSLDFKFEENKDLAIRPTRIFNSLWSIYTKVKHPLKLNIFFALPNKIFEGRRLSDMMSSRDILDSIKSDLSGHGPSQGFAIMHDLNKMKMHDIKAIFGLQGSGAEFHELYSTEIGLNRFVFNRSVYEFNFDQDKATYVRSMESEQFICAAGTYFQKIVKVNRNGSEISMLEKFQDDSFQKKFTYKSKEQIKTIKHDIPYFDSIDSKPSHTDYQEFWEHYNENAGHTMRFYNAYHPILYKAKKGDFPISIQFIKHVFGTQDVYYKGVKYNEYELGLDYCKLLYCKPEQFLPILCLVSEDRATGKTTFWDWMKEIYNNNVVRLSNKDLMSQFTSMYAGKLIAVIEEAFLDKFEFTEKAKELVTAEYTKLERKGKDAFEVANFIKLGITSNKTKNFATVDDKEVRFWVRKLDPIVTDPDFKTKLFTEIPYFLNYLEEREYHTNRETRAWFATDLIETQALKDVKQFSRSGNDLILASALKQYMLENRITVCHLKLSEIKDLIDDRDLQLKNIKTILEIKYNKPEPLKRTVYQTYHTDFYNVQTSKTVRGFAYSFTLSEFMSFEQIIENFEDLAISELLIMEEQENIENKFWSKLKFDDLKLIPKLSEFDKSAFEKANSLTEYLTFINILPNF